MRNKSGNIEAMEKGITNVFAEFYKDLYSKKNDEIETTSRIAKQDLKTLVLTMILKTVRARQTHPRTNQKRTDDCNRLSQKSGISDSKETKQKSSKELTKKQ